MKKLFLFLLLIGTIYSQDDQPDRLVRQSEFTDSLNSLRTLIGTGGVPLPDSVVYAGELPYVNVKDYGATLDGVTDDATAFNNALADIDDGGTLIINGIMGLGATGWTGIEIANKKNITIKGANKNSGIEVLAAPSQNFTSIKGIIKLSNCTNITITNLSVHGNEVATGFLLLINSQDCEVSNLYIDSMGTTAIFSAAGIRNRYINNTIKDNGGLGLLIGNTNTGYIEDKALISGNYLENNGASNINGVFKNTIISNNISIGSSGSGIGISAYSNEISQNVSIFGNYCARNNFHGIQSDGIGVNTKGITITNNVCEENYGTGIYIANCDDWIVSNNIIRNNDYDTTSSGGGILVYNSENITISGNLIYDELYVGDAGIALDASTTTIRNINIIGNSIRGFSTGFIASATTGVIRDINLTANHIDSCDYGVLVTTIDSSTFYNNVIVNNSTDIRLDFDVTGDNNLYSLKIGDGDIVRPSSVTNNYLSDGDFTNNSFFGGKKLYQSKIDNLLFSATSRFTVIDSGFSALDITNLFDGKYGSYGTISGTDTGKVYIDLTSKSDYDSNGVVYSQGYVLLHFFNTGKPSSVFGDIFIKDSTSWTPLTNPVDISTDTSYSIYKLSVPYRINMIKLRIFITGSNSTLNEIEYYRTREGDQVNPSFVSKYQPNSLYHKLSWKNFNNQEVAYIDSNGNAQFSNGLLVPDTSGITDGYVQKYISGEVVWSPDISTSGSGLFNPDGVTIDTTAGGLARVLPAKVTKWDSVSVKLNKADSTVYLTPYDASTTYQPKDTDLDNPDLALNLLQDSLDVKMNRAEMSGYATALHTHTEFFDTLSYSVNIPDTVIAGDNAIWKVPNNITIVEVSAFTNSGTVTFNIEERGETTPNTAGTDVMTSDLVADTDQQETTTFSNATLDKNDWMALVITSITGDPTLFGVTIYYVKTN